MVNATWDGGSIWVRLNAECVKVNKMTISYSKVEFQNKEKMNEAEDEDAPTKLGHKNVLIF